MARILILGATGSFGAHAVQQALAAGHAVSVIVRNASRLAQSVHDRVIVNQLDLGTADPRRLGELFRDQDAVVNAAGLVTEGQKFVDLVDRVVSGLESIQTESQPVCWFMAGAALLDIGTSGIRGVELPGVSATYWPHRSNFDRLARTSLDWRMLCPGPMVDKPPLGLARLRIAQDRLPVEVPSRANALPRVLLLPIFAYRVPEMIVPYADAAALILANLARGGAMSRRRVGLALPVGMRGRKTQWAAQPVNTT